MKGKKDKKFAERLVMLRNIKGLTQKGLAGAINMGESTIQAHEGGRYPTRNTLEKYAQFFQCNLSWIMTGEGEPWDVPLEDLPGVMGERARVMMQHAPRLSIEEDFEFIPMAQAKINAGNGLVPISEKFGEDFYAFRKEWLQRRASGKNNIFLIRVEGDSMSPLIADGDIAMIDQGRKNFRSGCIFALGVDDSVIVKKIEILPTGTIKIISVNREYQYYEMVKGDIRVIGQVIWVGKDLIKPDL